VALVNDLSFMDNPGNGLCNAATAKHDDVIALSHAMVVAFYEQYLTGKVGDHGCLTGSEAKTRYVDAGLAAIEHKP
jgi:hypothetical protein